MIYFNATCPHIGDAISAVPYMLHRQQLSGEVALVGPSFNEWVWDGLAVEGRLERASHAPPGAEIIEVHPKLAWNHCNANGWPWRMAEGHFYQAGHVPAKPFEVPFRPSSPTVKSHIVIAPFSVTDENGNKIWPLEYWLEFIRAIGLGTAENGDHIIVVGSDHDNMMPFYDAGASSWAGLSLPRVASLLRNTDCLVSIDTGIAHLGVMLNMRNHVVIYPRTVPNNFAETPFGVNVYGATPRHISVDSVLRAVARVIER